MMPPSPADRSAAPAVETAGRAPRPLPAALQAAADWLAAAQHAEGYWCGELEGDSILESEFILLQAWLGREQSPAVAKAANYLLAQQLPSGGWSMYPGGKLEISGSVKAYFALKIAGHAPDSEPLARARRAIRAAGGADAVNSFTRFFLALLGQIDYRHCPAVPPEAVLLPDWFPVNIYRVSAWSRTILVPLAIMWAHRPARQLPAEMGIEELFLRSPEHWPPLRKPGSTGNPRLLSWENAFRQLDRVLKGLERWRLRPLRGAALRSAERWMTERFTGSDGLGAIFPPIIWSVVALKCLGYREESPEVRYCHEQLERLYLEEEDSLRLQPCLSPVWDTAIALRALSAATAAGAPTAARSRDALQWLLEKEVTRPGDWSRRARAEPGGWFFEHHNEFYPDVDDTVMVLMALREQLGDSISAPPNAERGTEPSLLVSGRASELPEARRQTEFTLRAATAAARARRWVLAMQNADGGWGAFDRNNNAEFLCHVPFADHNAMIDPSTPDLAGRVLECLGIWGSRLGEPAIDRAVRYVRRSQEPDGAWFGRWGVNYIYGTWQCLAGLAAVGVRPDDPAIDRGVRWLVEHQHAEGGWGESCDTYERPELRGQGTPTPSQTAWALLGLMATGRARHPAVTRGVQWLLETQQANGEWMEEEWTGTGFPRVFYLRYHLYRAYFPLLALARYRQLTG